jgi:hypothetical protein
MSAPEPLQYASQHRPPTRDEEQMRLLSIFHYIVAGLAACGSCFALIYMVFGWLIEFGKFPAGANPTPTGVGLIFIAVGFFALVIGLAIATSIFLSGRYMASRRHLTFSIVVAGIMCLQIPFGTILSVFTLIVLSRESVKAMYLAANSAA